MGDSGCRATLLSPLDQLAPRSYARVFLVFQVSDALYHTAVQHMNNGLRQLARLVPYIKGNVSKQIDNGNRLALLWFNDPIPPRLAVPTANPASLPSFRRLESTNAPAHHFQNAFTSISVVPFDIGSPVFMASHIQLNGGMIISLCVHHGVMDDNGVAELVQLWASCCRGEAESEADPIEPLGRTRALEDASGLHELPKNPSISALVSTHPEYAMKNATSLSQPLPNPIPRSTSKIFTFSTIKLGQVINVLRSASNPDIDPNVLTINNILAALLWSYVTRVRLTRKRRTWQSDSSLPATSKLGSIVDGRTVLGDEFSAGRFFGNTSLNALCEAELTTLESASKFQCYRADASGPLIPDGSDPWVTYNFGSVIESLAAAAERVTKRHVAELLQLCDKVTDIENIRPAWQSFHTMDLALMTWLDQGIYEADFGGEVGKPKFVRVPYAEADGLVIVLPRRTGEEDEFIDVAMFLNVEDIKSLDEDEAWRSWYGEGIGNPDWTDKQAPVPIPARHASPVHRVQIADPKLTPNGALQEPTNFVFLPPQLAGPPPANTS